jgi:hypothetical protein
VLAPEHGNDLTQMSSDVIYQVWKEKNQYGPMESKNWSQGLQKYPSIPVLRSTRSLASDLHYGHLLEIDFLRVANTCPDGHSQLKKSCSSKIDLKFPSHIHLRHRDIMRNVFIDDIWTMINANYHHWYYEDIWGMYIYIGT